MALSSESNPKVQGLLVSRVGEGLCHVAHPKNPSWPLCNRDLGVNVALGVNLGVVELKSDDKFLCSQCRSEWNRRVAEATLLAAAIPADKMTPAGVWVTRSINPDVTHICRPQNSKEAFCGQSLFGAVTFGGVLALSEVSAQPLLCSGCVTKWNFCVRDYRETKVKEKAEEDARIEEEKKRAEEEAAADERVQSVLDWPVRKAERAKVLAVLWGMVSDCPGDPSILSWATELEERINSMDYR